MKKFHVEVAGSWNVYAENEDEAREQVIGLILEESTDLESAFDFNMKVKKK